MKLAQFHYDISDFKINTTKGQRGTSFIRRKIDTLVNNAGIGDFSRNYRKRFTKRLYH
jgi:short-subunit dehydrogenase